MSDATTGTATRVVLSYDPEAIDDLSRYWVEDELSRESFEGRVRRTYGAVAEGDTLVEAVSKGCGVPVEVTLRVERLDGGTAVGEGTAVEVRRRA
jgi:hypothetical protein